MIHIFVGTKAQFIKMAPVMRELDQRGIYYNFIDAGQHAEFTPEIVHEFGLRGPDVSLRPGQASINTVVQAVAWAVRGLSQIVFKPREIYQRIFRGVGGICLIHGDTLTTLLSLLYAKRCRIEVAHVEAGLRSRDFWNPFPEEMIRLIAMRYSDVLFAPSDWATKNLENMGYGPKTINIGANTIVEAIQEALRNRPARGLPDEPYAVVTIHRVENIYSRTRMAAIVSLTERITLDRQVFFVVHDPTRARLTRLGLDARLRLNQRIKTLPLQPYYFFINLLAGADFIVTDGGSVQEECYYLDVPCLIMRRRTEREDGLGENALLSGFEQTKIDAFLRDFACRRRASPVIDQHPSRKIVDHLSAWARS